MSKWRCPDATALLAAELTGTDVWLATRREGVGSSDLAALMGEGAGDDNAYVLWLDKTGRLVDDPRTGPMEWGLRAEDAAARWFAEEGGFELRRQGLLRSRREPLLQATVDRLVSDGGVLEVKISETGAAYRLAKLLRRGEIPRHWYWQLVGLLFVTGRRHVWLAAVVGGELYVLRVDYDEVREDMTRAVNAAYQFWYGNVETGEAPEQPPGLELADNGLVIDADLDLAVLLERWAKAKKTDADSEDWVELLRSQVLEAMGRAHLVRVNGRPFARRRVIEADRVDVARLRREDPATAAKFTTTGAHVRLELL